MKIQPIETLAKTVRELQSRGKTVALCHGCFDLMHPGHIKHFEAARRCADVLVVTVTPDRFVDKGPGRPVFPEQCRAESIAALQAVDYVAINHWPTAEETLRLLRPTCYVKGQEFKGLHDKTGKIQREFAVAQEIGVELRFTDEPVWSSTNLIREHGITAETIAAPTAAPGGADPYPESTRQYLNALARKYSFNDIRDHLERLGRLRVLLVGDGIIDEYHYCASMGRSTKAPLVVYKYRTHETYPGGAFAIANHLAGLCGQVHLVTLLGRHDTREEFIRANLRPNVTPTFLYRDDAPSIVKKRYLDQYLGQKVFEVNYLNDDPIHEALQQQAVDHLRHVSAGHDVTLLSDFGHGFITEAIIQAAREKSRVLAVNTQTNGANAGFNLITKYQGVDYVCLDEPEARLAVQERFGPIEAVARRLARSIAARCMVITLGKRGSVGVDAKNELVHCPIFSTRVVDTVGAGDAFFSYSSVCYTAGLPLDLVSFIGNVVGAIKVLTVCNKKPVHKDELLEFIRRILY